MEFIKIHDSLESGESQELLVKISNEYNSFLEGKNKKGSEKIYNFYNENKKEILKTIYNKINNQEIIDYVKTNKYSFKFEDFYFRFIHKEIFKENLEKKYLKEFPKIEFLKTTIFDENFEKNLDNLFQDYYKLKGKNGFEEIQTFISFLKIINKNIPIDLIKKSFINLIKNKELKKYNINPKSAGEEIIKDNIYWEIRNTIKLLEVGSRAVKENKDDLEVGGFSAGGSYGAIYLGSLYKKYEEKRLPDIYIGSSAGSLYTSLFLFWKKAVELSPKEMDNGSFQNLLSYLPDGLEEDDSMFWNGEEIISAFLDKFKYLINIINKKTGQNLDIENINYNDLGENLVSVASSLQTDKHFGLIYSGEDKIKETIIASSNPAFEIMGINVDILKSNHKVYGLEVNDGFFTNANPYEFFSFINPDKNIIFNSYSHSIDENENLDKNSEIIDPLNNTGNTEDSQSRNFDKDNALLNAYIGYIGYFNIDKTKELINFIQIDKNIKNKEKIYNKIFNDLIFKLEINENKINNIENFNESLSFMFSSDLFIEEQKKF